MARIPIVLLGLIAWVAACTVAGALPPLGLTMVSEQTSFSRLAVIDGVAYVSGRDWVLPITVDGPGDAIVPTPAASDASLLAVTRAVPGPSGAPYIVAEYLSAPDPYGNEDYFVAWHSLAAPDAPVAKQTLPSDIARTDGNAHLRGVDSTLRVLIDSGFLQLSELLPDGSSRVIEPYGSQYINVYDVASNGVAVGSAWVPNTIGSAGALLYPDDRVLFTGTYGGARAVRVSPTGEMNVGYWSDRQYVRYGNEPPIAIDASLGSSFEFETRVLVSESRFTVVTDPDEREPRDHRAFFPGISEDGFDRSIGLEEVFPELATLGGYDVRDLASHRGQIHLLLSNDAGLWLFAAPDPSLIPEPTALGLAGLMIAAASGGHRRRR